MDESWLRAQQVAEGQHWLLTGQQARAAGLLPSQIASRLRAGAWHSLYHDVYLVDADSYDQLPRSTWWRAALLRHGPAACLVGRTGARALDIAGLPETDQAIEIGIVGGIPRVTQPGRPLAGRLAEAWPVVVRQLVVASDEVVRVDGMRVRAARHTVVDCALQLSRAHALSVLDSALHNELVDAEELDLAVVRAKGRPGCAQLRAVAELADGRAESPLESRVRLICIDGGLPPDELQYAVRGACGDVVAIGDLAWFRRRRRPLLGEADGQQVHSLPTSVFRDRRRGNELTGRACDTVRFVWADTLRPPYILYVVRQALAAA